MTRQFDAIIIGAGQAGPPLASRLSKAGMSVAFVERNLFGGTCVNTGCIPTKTMVASAYAAHMARRAAEFGVEIESAIKINMKAVKARKDLISGQSRQAVEKGLRSLENCTVFHQQARFLSAHQVQAGDQILSATRIFINVGARAQIPALKGIDSIPYLTNATILDLDTLPDHLVVIGGSYIGLEFAQMFRRFGSKVTIVERGARLVQHEDEDVSAAIKEILELEDIDIRLDSECIAFEKNEAQIAVHVSCKDTQPVAPASHLLLAMGRLPNTGDLGLTEAGIHCDEHGYIQVDDQLRTNVDGVWALGDCNGKGGFTHTSYNDFEIVAANLLENDPRRVSDRIKAHALYIDPPLGSVGLTETEVRASSKKALIATRPMTKVGRATEKGETLGFMKILVDADSRKILGASILGTAGDEAIHCILDTMYAGVPYTNISRAMHIHPTVSELIPTLLQDLKPLN